MFISQAAVWLGLIGAVLCLGCQAKSPTPPASGYPATALQAAHPEGARAVAQDERPAVRFHDVTKSSGVDFVYHNGEEAGHDAILQSLGGGVGLFDFDLDGRLDIFLPGGGGFEGERAFGLPSALFRNHGQWRFTNVSQPAGDGFDSPHYTHGCFAADYDNDGFQDLLVTGYGGLQLWKNQGDGTFVERHKAAQLTDDSWSSAAGWGDIDGDGLLDLYVTHYVNWSFDNHPYCSGPHPEQREICSPRVFDPLPDTLYRNAGDGSFIEISDEAPLRDDGKGLGVALGDIDLDGDTDIYVANDTTENFLYLNHGDGSFDEAAALNGAAVDDRGTPNGSMGVDFGDYNLDGLPDIWAANFEVESFALYRNEGNALFVHVSQATGITALNGLFVGFGTAFTDLDCDGDEDLAVANGHVINYPRNAPLRQLPLVLSNNEGRRYLRLPLKDPYFTSPHAGRGLAVGDVDEDGDPDLVFSNNDEPAALLRNDTATEGNWLRVQLIGRRSNRDGIGAVLTLRTSEGDRLRLVKGGTSYLSHSDLKPYWGIPPDMAAHVLEARWPSGRVQEIAPVPLNQTLQLREPEG